MNVPEDRRTSSAGYLCARAWDRGRRMVDPVAMNWCQAAQSFTVSYRAWLGDPARPARMTTDIDLPAGKCTCREVVSNDERACGHVTSDLRNFCSAPTKVPIAIGEEDGRIGRRIK